MSLDLTPDFGGRWHLSPREKRVAAGVLRGLANKELAYELGLSENTVRNHLSHLYRKHDIQKCLDPVFLLLGTVPAWAGVEFGAGVIKEDAELGASVTLSGVSSGDAYFGGFGGAVASRNLRLGVAGVVAGVRLRSFLSLSGRAGLGGGTYGGAVGATSLWAAELAFA